MISDKYKSKKGASGNDKGDQENFPVALFVVYPHANDTSWTALRTACRESPQIARALLRCQLFGSFCQRQRCHLDPGLSDLWKKSPRWGRFPGSTMARAYTFV